MKERLSQTEIGMLTWCLLMNYFFWILQVNEDNEPSCSKQQDEGEHTCQPHNYCSRINPVLTQEKNCVQSPGHSSLIVSSSHLEVWRNMSTRGKKPNPYNLTYRTFIFSRQISRFKSLFRPSN